MALNDSIPFVLDHERLEVYRVALELHTICCALLPTRGWGVLRDQLERASLGVVLNIAEGAGRGSAADKRRFYEMARGSATESAAALEVLRLRRLVDSRRLVEARSLAIRVVQMLSAIGAAASLSEGHTRSANYQMMVVSVFILRQMPDNTIPLRRDLIDSDEIGKTSPIKMNEPLRAILP